jgi:hypothetical protein
MKCGKNLETAISKSLREISTATVGEAALGSRGLAE